MADRLVFTFPDGLKISFTQEDPVRSTEAADHGNYNEFQQNHPINRLTDQHPGIVIPRNVKRSKNIKSFNNETALYQFINNKIASLLRGPPKKFIAKYRQPILKE